MLLRRYKEPWKGKWNGVGGKINSGENPRETVYREVAEETGIDLMQAKDVRFTGIVTWDAIAESNVVDTMMYGMYVYIAELSSRQIIWNEPRNMKEGILAWKSLKWSVDKDNKRIADNVPHFLQGMLDSVVAQYHCNFEETFFKSITQKNLPSEYLGL